MHKTLILLLLYTQYMWMMLLHLIVKLSDAKRHASLLSSFLLENFLYSSVNELINFQKLVGNLDKMTVANLDRQHQRYLDS